MNRFQNMEMQIFQDIVHLLQGADWLYNYPMTQVFTRNKLTQMPMEWKAALQDLPLDVLNGLPRYLILQHWPPSLKMFLQECQRLSCLTHLTPQTSGDGSSSSSSDLQIPQELTRGLSVKKKHEITTLLNVVKEMLNITGSKHILDIGSGKGYVDFCIHRILHTQVLGVDGNSKLMRSAKKHHRKLYGWCRGITFLNWHLSDNTETLCRAEQLVSYLTKFDTSCSCQPSIQNKIFSGRSRKRPDSPTGTDRKSDIVWGEGVENECADSASLTGSDGSVGNATNTCVLLGLHACADLSPIIIKVFRDCPQVSSLVLFSCCYHKMSLRPKAVDKPKSEDQGASSESNTDLENLEMHPECLVHEDPRQNEEVLCEESDFMNFPMSQSLQEIFRQNNFNMSVFGLRLGAQKSGQGWCSETQEDHEYHLRNVAYRGILEAACAKEDFTLQKLKRRCVRRSGFKDFSEYKKVLFEHYEFQNIGSDDTKSRSTVSKDEIDILKRNTQMSATLDSCYEDYKQYFPLIEPLTGLQLALQPVIESMVQLDRLIYLKECGFSEVRLQKLFDDDISPRNIALLAVR